MLPGIVVFLLSMELEVFPKGCCDVVSQILPTVGHHTNTKELFLDVKKSGHLYIQQKTWFKCS